MRLYRFILALVLTLSASPGFAQDAQTLADIRQELQILKSQMQSLQAELSGTGGTAPVVSGDLLQRVDAIEAQVAGLTAQTESLQNRINAIVSDGTNRIGDIEFRLVELEGGDLSTLADTPVLGGEAVTGAAPVPQPDSAETGGVELAVAERADFERAQEALASGDFRSAADKFATFTQSYPGGPLSADAHFLRGEALSKLGDWNSAARAYLDSFSGSPEASRAPEALHKLGLSLNELGQKSEACLMLREVVTRFPASDQVAQAQSSMQSLSCS